MDLAFLEPVVRTPGPWASAYLANATPGPDAATHQELAARQARDDLTEQGAGDAEARGVYEELNAPRPGPPGRAVFAANGAVVREVPLGSAPPATEASWSAVPRLTPLVEMAEDSRVCLLAYVDRQGADFELRHARGAETVGRVDGESWPVNRTTSSDWSERRFQTAVENTWERNAAETAEELAKAVVETEADVVLLVGDERQRRSVHDRLPQALASRVVETDRGGRAPGARTSLLDEEVARLLRERREQEHSELLERFRAGLAGADGAAATEGVPSLVEAARERRIATLVIVPGGSDHNREVWVGGEPDQLAMRRTEARSLGADDPASARADDALLRAVVAAGGDVVVVDPSAYDGVELPSGGLGAVLRWAHGEESQASIPAVEAEAEEGNGTDVVTGRPETVAGA
ncbi:baeRF2 domain-containing protein [Streptomyces otsuchiensis]|uniref:baeRF2 domain-containing protein n=1 Tax=Streptomyces otsuchiensis TaxID=2681388 RepID=UPI0013006856|nr:Vms1/Ankzf1 family peptidyl-tRNA hydrolase [Streptomyces otsuchiensis]